MSDDLSTTSLDLHYRTLSRGMEDLDGTGAPRAPRSLFALPAVTSVDVSGWVDRTTARHRKSGRSRPATEDVDDGADGLRKGSSSPNLGR